MARQLILHSQGHSAAAIAWNPFDKVLNLFASEDRIVVKWIAASFRRRQIPDEVAHRPMPDGFGREIRFS